MDNYFASDAYRAWRAKVPFTNEAIAAALRAEADRCDQMLDGRHKDGRASVFYRQRADAVEAGAVTGYDVRTTLAVLVQACGICGKRALYRYGAYGRCRAHKDHQTAAFRYIKEQHNAKSASFGTAATHRDALTLSRESLRRAKAARG